MGETAEMSRRLVDLTQDARKRGDLFAATNLGTWIMSLVRIAADQPEEAKQELAEIVRCTESVLAGYTVMPELDHGKSGHADEAERLATLSDKELVVMQMLAKGMSNKEIGEVLFISNKTVSTHKTRVMEKLEAKTIVDIIDFARRHHIALG